MSQGSWLSRAAALVVFLAGSTAWGQQQAGPECGLNRVAVNFSTACCRQMQAAAKDGKCDCNKDCGCGKKCDCGSSGQCSTACSCGKVTAVACPSGACCGCCPMGQKVRAALEVFRQCCSDTEADRWVTRTRLICLSASLSSCGPLEVRFPPLPHARVVVNVPGIFAYGCASAVRCVPAPAAVFANPQQFISFPLATPMTWACPVQTVVAPSFFQGCWNAQPVPAPVRVTNGIIQTAFSAVTENDPSYLLECRLVRVRENGKLDVLAEPKLTFLEGQTPEVQIGGDVVLQEGSVQDLLCRSSQAGPENKVFLGRKLRVKVTGISQDKVKVDLTMLSNEVDQANKSGIVVRGSSLRTVQKVELGQVKKLTLEGQGKESCRLEFKVTRVTN